MNEIPVAGEWYAQLPKWHQFLFNVCCRVIGDMLALSVCGYWRYARTFEKKETE